MEIDKVYELSDDEKKEIEDWLDDHECTLEEPSCCGGEYSIEFTPTSIGMGICVKCACGKMHELDTIG